MKNQGDTWRGFLPITGFVLDALERKCAAQGRQTLTRSEAVLLVVCELLAAASRRTLAQYLRGSVLQTLASGVAGMLEIGAASAASVLRLGINDLRNSQFPDPESTVIRNLEDKLLHSEDQMDVLIARYAADKASGLILYDLRDPDSS